MPMFPPTQKIRVLVVDDSVLARTMITQGLSKSSRIDVVGTAFNAQDARTKIDRLKPDVMTLDVEMPGMNGIDFLKQLLPVVPLPVILVSSLNLRVFDALSAGAVDFVRKPEPGQNDTFIQNLTQKVLTAAGAKVRPRPGGPLLSTPPPVRRPDGAQARRAPAHHRERPRLPSPPASGQPPLHGQCNHRTGGLHRRDGGHPGGHAPPARRHSRYAHRAAYARRLHPDVR